MTNLWYMKLTRTNFQCGTNVTEWTDQGLYRALSNPLHGTQKTWIIVSCDMTWNILLKFWSRSLTVIVSRVLMPLTRSRAFNELTLTKLCRSPSSSFDLNGRCRFRSRYTRLTQELQLILWVGNFVNLILAMVFTSPAKWRVEGTPRRMSVWHVLTVCKL